MGEGQEVVGMLRGMFQLDLEQRKSARELLMEPWLTEDHFEAQGTEVEQEGLGSVTGGC